MIARLARYCSILLDKKEGGGIGDHQHPHGFLGKLADTGAGFRKINTASLPRLLPEIIPVEYKKGYGANGIMMTRNCAPRRRPCVWKRCWGWRCRRARFSMRKANGGGRWNLRRN